MTSPRKRREEKAVPKTWQLNKAKTERELKQVDLNNHIFNQPIFNVYSKDNKNAHTYMK